MYRLVEKTFCPHSRIPLGMRPVQPSEAFLRNAIDTNDIVSTERSIPNGMQFYNRKIAALFTRPNS